MQRTARKTGRRRKWIAAALSPLLLVWLFLGQFASQGGIVFDWDATVGFRSIDACPYASGLLRVITAPYCLLIEVQARPLVKREFRKAGWVEAKGYLFENKIPFLPVVTGLNRATDWRIVDPKVTPLMDAAKSGDIARVKQLLAGGADVNARDQRGYTALMHASMGLHDRADVVRILLSAGADLNARDKSGQSALAWAMQNRIQIGIVKELVSAGADVNVRDSLGTPVLVYAVSSGTDEVAAGEAVKLLIAAGADLGAKDSQGETALSLAMRIKRFQIAQTLKQAGSPDAKP